MIKAVFFDVDGTLYPIKEQNKMFLKLFFLHPIKTIYYRIARKKIRCYLKDKICSYLNRKDFLKLQAKMVKKNDDYFDDIYSFMKDNYKIKPHKYVLPLLNYLKHKGYILGVLSDFPLFNKLDTLNLDSFFEYKLSAEDVGFLKPHKNAFQHIIDKTQLKKEEILYIGDSKIKDKEGACAFGMTGYLIDKSSSVSSVRKDIDRILDIAT